MIAPCTTPRKYPIVSSLVAGRRPRLTRVLILSLRSGFLIAPISGSGRGSDVRRFKSDRCRRWRGPNAMNGEHARAHRQVDRGTQEHRGHAAEAIEKDLRDALEQEGHADGESADQ